MSIKVNEIMKERVITATPHQSVGHVKEIVSRNKIGVVPVVGPEMEILGIVSTADLIQAGDGTPISKIMTEEVRTVPLYADVELAARMMRKHRIHHIAVVHEKKLKGILSSFDLLQLVEGHRFVMKNAPTKNSHRGK